MKTRRELIQERGHVAAFHGKKQPTCDLECSYRIQHRREDEVSVRMEDFRLSGCEILKCN